MIENQSLAPRDVMKGASVPAIFISSFKNLQTRLEPEQFSPQFCLQYAVLPLDATEDYTLGL